MTHVRTYVRTYNMYTVKLSTDRSDDDDGPRVMGPRRYRPAGRGSAVGSSPRPYTRTHTYYLLPVNARKAMSHHDSRRGSRRYRGDSSLSRPYNTYTHVHTRTYAYVRTARLNYHRVVYMHMCLYVRRAASHPHINLRSESQLERRLIQR